MKSMGNANTFEKIMKEKEKKESKLGEYPNYSVSKECQRCYIGVILPSQCCYHCGAK